MKHIIKKYIKPFILSAVVLVAPVMSRAQSDVQVNLNNTAGAAQLAGGTTDFAAVIGGVVFALMGIVGALFMVLVLVGGVQWMTAGGSEEKVSKAKKMITNSVIGLIIVIFSYAIATFVVNRANDALTQVHTNVTVS